MLNKDFAVVFPGQGSQHLGMLNEINLISNEVQLRFEEASDALGYNLWDITQNDSDKLNQTEFTQPALLTASYVIWCIYSSKSDALPKIMAGHSLGEYTALVAAGSLNFVDAVRLVAARGKFMQEAQPVGIGAMAAILGLDNDKIADVLASINDSSQSVVEIANLNAHGQTVIAGSKHSVVLAMEQLKIKGAKIVKLLDVSVPSHCSLMLPAAERLKGLLDQTNFKTPNIPVIHNYSLASYTDPLDIKHALFEQLIRPVRWVETIEFISAHHTKNIYEFGPGSVLSKLCKRIDDNVKAEAINSIDAINNLSQ